jgi:hypothetical protein
VFCKFNEDANKKFSFRRLAERNRKKSLITFTRNRHGALVTANINKN